MKKILSLFMVSIMAITSIFAKATAWDGETVTTSMDDQVVTSLEDLNGLQITLPGATSIVALGEEDAAYLVLGNKDGSAMYGVWSIAYGSTCTIEGNKITLDGFIALDGYTAAIPAGTTKLYIEDYGTFMVDDAEAYIPTIELNANIGGGSAEPFTLTSVENNGVAGSIMGVEASADGIAYQFTITATGKQLSQGTATPTLSLFEDSSKDFGAASVLAFGAESAYIRFMALQQYYFTTPGTYVLNIPEGTFVDENGAPNAAAVVKWVIIESETVEPFAITSVVNGYEVESGSEVEALNYNFSITAASAITGLNEGNITLTDANNQPVGGNAYVFGYEGEEGATTVYARFTFDSEDHCLHTPGTYTIHVPAGMFKAANNALNTEFTASWTIKETRTPQPFDITAVVNGADVAPDAEVEALAYNFSITAANAITALNEGNITLTDANNQPVGGNAYVYGYEGEEGATTVYARFTFDSEDHMLHTPGTYTLNIPAGMFKDANGDFNTEFSASWTVKEAGPRTWTFSNGKNYPEIADDAAHWNASSKGRYSYALATDNEELLLGESPLGLTAGLKFKAAADKILIGVTGEYYMQMQGTVDMTIPQINAGDTLVLLMSSNNKDNAAVITGDLMEGITESSTSKQTRTAIAMSTGDLKLTLNNRTRLYALEIHTFDGDFNEVLAAIVVNKINAIGTVEFTDECKARIEEARAAYQTLNDDAKALISAEQLKVLTDAEAAYLLLQMMAELPEGNIDLKELTGTNTNWANSVTYPKTLAVQGESFGDGDGSNEATHVNIADYEKLSFVITEGSTGGSVATDGLALRVWFWDDVKNQVVTLYAHPDSVFETADFTQRYGIAAPGIYSVNIADYKYLKGVKAENNWGAPAIVCAYACVVDIPAPVGTEENPIVIIADEPVQGPAQGVMDPVTYQYSYTYYVYTATKDGVVKLDLSNLGYVMGGVTIGEKSYSYGSSIEVKEGDVLNIKLTAQEDATGKTFTLSIRDYAEGETMATAKVLVEGENEIAGIANGGLANYYSIVVPAGKKMTIAFDGYPSAYMIVGETESQIEYQGTGYTGIYDNEGQVEQTIYIKINALYQACKATVTFTDLVALSNINAAASVKDGKYMINGKFIIVKNGRTFNAAGQMIK